MTRAPSVHTESATRLKMAASFSPLSYAPATPNLSALGPDSESPKQMPQQRASELQQQQQQHEHHQFQQQQDQHQLQQQLPLMAAACGYTAAAAAAADSSQLVNIYGPAYAAAAQSRFLSSLSNPMAAAAAGETAAAAAAAAGLYGAHGCYSAAAAASWRSQAAGYPHTGYDAWHPAAAAATAYAYGSNPIHDLNGQRRKNATRESTTTLKAWLNEHKTNPYPTKGEKIMLAIITKMTLTQVSTWFANARRRLKKENKMTWSERNSSNDGACDDADDGEDDAENERSGDEIEPACAMPQGPMSQQPPSVLEDQFDRPKIWSLAYTATSTSPLSACDQALQQQHPAQHHPFQLQQTGHQGHHLQHYLPHHLQHHQLQAAHRQHLHHVMQQQQQHQHQHHQNQVEFPAIMDPNLTGIPLTGGIGGSFQTAASEVLALNQ